MTIRRPLSFSRISSALVLLGACLVAHAQAIDSLQKQQVLESLIETLKTHAYVPGVDFSKVSDYLKAQEKPIDRAQNQEEFREAIAQGLRSFGLSHIVLFTPRMVESRRENKAVGIGIYPAKDKDGFLITRVLPGGPAANAGLEAGDVILTVDDKEPATLNQLLGAEGTTVDLVVRKYSGEKVELHITRRKFSTVRPATLTWIDKSISILAVPTFDTTYDRLQIERLVRESNKGSAVIIDLRNNPGGAIANLNHLAGLFLSPGTVLGSYVTKRSANEYQQENPGMPLDPIAIADWTKAKIRTSRNPAVQFKGKVVLMMNGLSGSASEIFGAAMREQLGAPIVGKKSAGAVLVSVISSLPHGFMIQYPISDYITLKGVRLEGHGITPDQEAEEPRIVREGIPDDGFLKATNYAHMAIAAAESAKIH